MGLCCKHEVCAGLCGKWRAGTRAGALPAASTPEVPELTPEWVKRENCYVLTRNGAKGAQGEVVKIDTLTMDPWADTHDQIVQNPLFQLPENLLVAIVASGRLFSEALISRNMFEHGHSHSSTRRLF